MELGPQIGEGKTKIVYVHPTDPLNAILYFKDTITAGDGAKKDVIAGKGSIDWRTNKNIFELLKRQGVPTHYVSSPEERYSVVRRMTKRVALEVVGRRIATGSYLDEFPEIPEGIYFPELFVQWHYKDDGLHDPKLDARYIQEVLTKKKKTDVYDQSSEFLKKTFGVLEEALAKQRHQLIDLKIEVGYVQPEGLVVVDEITAGSLRVWPFVEGVEVLDTSQPNVLSQLNKGGMLDKQVYREGGALDKVKSRFELFAELTDKF